MISGGVEVCFSGGVSLFGNLGPCASGLFRGGGGGWCISGDGCSSVPFDVERNAGQPQLTRGKAALLAIHRLEIRGTKKCLQ